MNDRTIHDCIVIGGGPAGCAAATTLARHGRSVLVLEKESFPRYHIGESLVPYCYFPLERMGMIPKLKASAYTKKYSVQFVSGEGKLSQPFYFWEHTDHDCAQTWQVLRSDFDTQLRDNAREHGVDFRERITVTDFLRRDGAVCGVIAEGPEGEKLTFEGRTVVDASGRDAVSQNRNRWRVFDPNLQRLAIWTYFKGAKRDEGRAEGATTVAYVDGKNWFWYIPLAGDVVSVGVVGKKDYLFSHDRDPEAIFRACVKRNKWIEDHLATGTQTGPVKVTTDYSYRSEFCAEDNLVLAGDALAFLDPVFSSGMFFALYGGVLAADAIHAGLEKGDTSAASFQEFSAKFRHGFEAMRKLVYGFYEEKFTFASIFKKHPGLKDDLTDCLIGNVEKDFTRLFQAFEEFIPVPKELDLARVKESALAAQPR